jgi:enamine deaminase RidA (YjgF/YER057c/UK114 family)
VVKTTVYLQNGVDRSMFLGVYTEQFKRRLRSPWMPAGLTMDIDALRLDCLIEIDAVSTVAPRIPRLA